MPTINGLLFSSAFGCEHEYLVAVCEWLARRHVMKAAGVRGALVHGWDLVLKQQGQDLRISSTGRMSLSGPPQVEGLAVLYQVGDDLHHVFWSAAENSLHPSLDDWKAGEGKRGVLPQDLVAMYMDAAMKFREVERQCVFLAGEAARAIEGVGLATRARLYPVMLERARNMPLSRIAAVDYRDAVKEMVNDYKREHMGV